MSDGTRRAHDARKKLLDWFERSARGLPWRTEPRDPYRVLVSELMLQQTQVDRVVPRFGVFVARFPDLASLAAADEAEVLEAWSGLGYYRRARSLHELARRLVSEGRPLPSTVPALLELPGIGPYTAAAVASLAHDVPEPVLDGNVLRVAARVLALDGDPRSSEAGRTIRQWVRDLMGEDVPSPGVVNEALMELGALVCRPRGPRCGDCPLHGACEARASGTPERWPGPRAATRPHSLSWVAAVVRSPSGRWLLRRVDHGPILRGLWLPPFAEAEGSEGRAVAVGLVPVAVRGGAELALVRHSITHRRIRVRPVLLEAAGESDVGEGWAWVDPEDPGVPTSSLLPKLVAVVRET